MREVISRITPYGFFSFPTRELHHLLSPTETAPAFNAFHVPQSQLAQALEQRMTPLSWSENKRRISARQMRNEGNIYENLIII